VPRSLLTPLAAICVALAWSGGWIMGKLAVESAPPLEFSGIRFVVASAALAMVAAATRTRIGSGDVGPVVLTAIFGYLGYNAFVFVGLTMAPASDAALIVPTTIPVLTAVAASFVGERITASKLVGFVLASVGGLLVIAAGQTGAEVSARRLTGDLLLLAGAICWAIYTALGAITLRRRPPLAVVTLAAPVGAVLLLPLGFLEHGYRDVPSWSAQVWSGVFYLALVVTVGSFTLFYWVVRRVGAGIAAMSSYFVPVITLAMATAFLGERPQPLQLVGGLVILAGVRIATLRPALATAIPEGAS
jgi:drug/metabolite transporter (DMT)-like permease